MDGKDIMAENRNMGGYTSDEEPKERDLMSEKKDEVSFLRIFCQTKNVHPEDSCEIVRGGKVHENLEGCSALGLGLA